MVTHGITYHIWKAKWLFLRTVWVAGGASSMPSMKKLVTSVTGTVRMGPATGYIAKVLGCHHQLLPFNDAGQSLCWIWPCQAGPSLRAWMVWYSWAKDNALHHLGLSFQQKVVNGMVMQWWNPLFSATLPLVSLFMVAVCVGTCSKYWQ